MDAVEFLKALERRRNYKRGPNDGHCNWAFIYFDHRSHEELVAEVEQWAKEHPSKTRQSEFLEQWPEARIDKTTGVLTICPAELTKECRDDREACGAYSVETCVCEPCRREFWMQEVE